MESLFLSESFTVLLKKKKNKATNVCIGNLRQAAKHKHRLLAQDVRSRIFHVNIMTIDVFEAQS